MPHLESTIKTQRITCLKKFIDKLSQSMEINPLAPSHKNYRNKFLLHCNYDVADLPKSPPKFHCQCFEAWATLTEKQPTSLRYMHFGILNIFVSMANLSFVKSHFMAGISRSKDIFLKFFKCLNLNNYLLISGISKALPES